MESPSQLIKKYLESNTAYDIFPKETLLTALDLTEEELIKLTHGFCNSVHTIDKACIVLPHLEEQNHRLSFKVWQTSALQKKRDLKNLISLTEFLVVQRKEQPPNESFL